MVVVLVLVKEVFVIKSVSFHISDECNLRCAYCNIKHAKKNTITKDVFDSYLQFMRKYPEEFKDVEGFSLWGSEPELGLDNFIDSFPEILKEYPKVKRVTFSSNYVEIERKKKLFSIIPKGTNILLDMQYSLDGWEGVHNLGRGGNFNKILDNIKEMARFLRDNWNPGVTSFRFFNKGTWCSEILAHLVEGDNFKRNIEFIKELRAEIHETLKDTPGIYYGVEPVTNMALPYWPYTKQDGLNFTEVLKRLKKTSNVKLPFWSYYKTFLSRDFLRYPKCSAGFSEFGVSAGEVLHACHRSFPPSDYLNSIQKGNFSDKSRLGFTCTNANLYPSLRLSSLQTMAQMLSDMGVIDKRYSEPLYINLLHRFVERDCPMVTEKRSGCNFAQPPGLFNLFCNGALEEFFV
jgi:hypothetical protein